MGYKKLKTLQWNILEGEDNDLLIVSLKGSDGKDDHCVTLFGKWIFDSNFKNALPLCKDSLDLCCSSDEKKDTFVSVAQARKFSDWKYLIPSKKITLLLFVCQKKIYITIIIQIIYKYIIVILNTNIR